ncbi:cytochrome ubiquinol oxidase subunit I [Allofrancisella guangzhouensis]|uniref:Cytochrome BD oxidase subunit I n=1 Tax=Allofrancisella guangzhouensis TaxID=594679 RepID=A0A0A8E3N4_9GAMM|nr:cytochrome ubiquinol oxidase subunit I [Allofrancisella guangzhouensis]AJC48549.1 cytochrome BD oxidase subunit I [Allofrancisella guangzhouensis]MBK2027786.1 cytochrome ubiquinol oxidase subunit I [Allofrancisella guangzhouensis]MBK2043524.1 cytochrome ubiquinol oxidase subunit I [Allofrancisella guangzhouensis]MBK2045773.1 cytochrome ubiquinol oxidase subunit I [Allofrancisella guangzhouensis]
MLPTLMSVDLARWQFGLTASFHFLFVPLTLGLTWIIFTMELMYIRTGKEVYKDMVKFWGKLLGINFALGIITGLTMEFEFGTNWSYYSQSVGDIFGTPLAIEGLAAFMLESTFAGLFFFGWDKLSKKQHLLSTFCMAIGSSFSALLILVANGYMQHPVGSEFVASTMRMETVSLLDVFLNHTAQTNFGHVMTAGYTTAAMFVVGISAYYIIRGRDLAFAKRSLGIGLGFGLVTCIVAILFGDANGVDVFKVQPLKMAAIEAEWETSKAPAAFNAVALPSQKEQKNNYAVEIPAVLGLIATHSTDVQIPGVKAILYGKMAADGTRDPNFAYYRNIKTGTTAGVSPDQAAANPSIYEKVPSALVMIKQGGLAYADLLKWRESGHSDDKPNSNYKYYNNPEYQRYIGFGKMLTQVATEKYGVADSTTITKAANNPEIVRSVATNMVPDVASVFWSFRVMVFIGFFMFGLIIVGLILLIRNVLTSNAFTRFTLRVMTWSIPLPFIACLAGWYVTEHGRQPWTVYNELPTSISSSALTSIDVATSMAIFLLIDTALFAVLLFLMFKYAKLGPSSLGTGKYHFEQNKQDK